jgi:hypothetical protein
MTSIVPSYVETHRDVERGSAVAAARAAARAVPMSSAPPSAVTATGGASAPATSSDVPDDATKGSAVLTITSDLPARLTIDGAPAGVTPRTVKRAPGHHVIGLASIELDEHLSATVDAKPAATLSVHAEFTRAVPVLRVR